jgi:DNA-binding LacI/PurR family transcriptional regulator
VKPYRRVTLQDVAREAKVSYASVSAVLNNKDGQSIRVSEKTRAKILECAARLGYVPNMAARRLKGGSNSLIAVFTYEPIFPIESQSEFYRFFVGIQERAEALGYDILILNNRPTEESASRVALADGAVMFGINRDDKGIRRLVEANFPLVFVGRREVGESPTRWVTFDYRSVIFQMVDHLRPLCRQKEIIYVESHEHEREPRRDKRSFLREAAQQHGLSVHIVQADESNRINDADFATIVEKRVVLFDRIHLLKPFERKLERANLKIGRDLWGGMLEDDWLGEHGQWTRWSNQRFELGDLAVRYLSKILNGSSLDGFEMLVPLHLVIAESSAFALG